MHVSHETLDMYAQSKRVTIDKMAHDKFEIYAERLVAGNSRVNLTSITDTEGITVKHFIDSISILSEYFIDYNSKIVDIGAGAGFPSIPILILRPDIRLTIIDSIGKRIEFLRHLSKELDLSIRLICGRAEEYGKDEQYREGFDYAVARAVAKLNVLSEFCLPYVRVGGRFISMKGPGAGEEIEKAENSIQILGGAFEKKIDYKLPNDEQRNLIIVKKISQTSPKYPRPYNRLSKKPL